MRPPRHRRLAHGAAAVLWSLLMVGAAIAGTASSPLELQPDSHYRNTARHLQYFRDPSGHMDVNTVIAPGGPAFAPYPRDKIDFGFTHDRIWLRLPVINASAHPETRILSLNTRFMNRLDAYVVRGGTAHLLLHDSEAEPFWNRTVPYRLLVTRFSLDPAERADIVIGYASDGTTALPFSIETEASFARREVYEETKNAAFYAAAGVMILLSLIFMPVVRWRVHLAYAVYVTWVALYVAHMDGYTLQYLWPGWPQLNAYAALPLGYCLNVFAAIFCRTFLQTRTEFPVADKVLLGVIWLTLAIIAFGSFHDSQWIKHFGFLYTFAAAWVFFGVSLAALRKRRPGLRFFLLGWVGIIASAAYSSVAHWSTGTVAVNASFDTIRGGILIEAFLFVMAMSEQLRAMRRERDAVMEREVGMLQEQVKLEGRRAYAEALADARRAQLASASHDLKQPLVSLRMMLQRAIGDEDDKTAASVRNAVAYLEGLVHRYLEQSDPGTVPDEGGDPAGQSEQGNEERFPVSIVLENVVRMFADEARHKGIRMTQVPSDQVVYADPMAAMRVVSNLVANAVKHTDEGKVLIGCRRRGRRIRIEVHDTGPGIEDGKLTALRQAFANGARITGRAEDGLGLGISIGLARQQGYGFEVTSRRGVGSAFTVDLPRG